MLISPPSSICLEEPNGSLRSAGWGSQTRWTGESAESIREGVSYGRLLLLPSWFGSKRTYSLQKLLTPRVRRFNGTPKPSTNPFALFLRPKTVACHSAPQCGARNEVTECFRSGSSPNRQIRPWGFLGRIPFGPRITFRMTVFRLGRSSGSLRRNEPVRDASWPFFGSVPFQAAEQML